LNLIKGYNMECPKCKKDTLKHMHNEAYGIAGTHMAGSERFECKCGFRISNKDEAKTHGLEFILDA